MSSACNTNSKDLANGKEPKMEVDKQDKKRKKADISSDLDTSCQDNDLSYLDLDTK